VPEEASSDARWTVLRTMVTVRPSVRRWAYIGPGLFGLLFVGHAYEDDGWRSACLYLALLVGSVMQAVRPTLLGWCVVVFPVIIFVPTVFGAVGSISTADWVAGGLLFAVPLAGVALGHPWARSRGLDGGASGRDAA